MMKMLERLPGRGTEKGKEKKKHSRIPKAVIKVLVPPRLKSKWRTRLFFYKPSINNILELPNEMIANILDWLHFIDCRSFLSCGNRVLWTETRLEYESKMATHVVLSNTPPYRLLPNNFENVVQLDLGPHCSNILLSYMIDEQVLPNLTRLSMRKSVTVTDAGLALLGRNPNRCNTLEYIDLCYCRGTTYAIVAILLQHLHALHTVRRQPEWMDVCEVGVYGWPDGSFLFLDLEGNMVQCGYLADLYSPRQNYVVAKRQYAYCTTFSDDSWQVQEDWMRHGYRPGQAFLQVDGGVLLAAPARGIYPPATNWPCASQAPKLPVGLKVLCNQQGIVRQDPSEEDAYVHLMWYSHDRHRKVELGDPPCQVRDLCLAQIDDMRTAMTDIAEIDAEKQAHLRTGGKQSDEPPPEWFQALRYMDATNEDSLG